MVTFAIVVAVATEKLGIGYKGEIPWKCSKDMKYFRDLTTTTNDTQRKNVVIMGRKTWESLPSRYRPLPNRINIVLTNTISDKDVDKGCDLLKCNSITNALLLLEKRSDVGKIFVIGGGQVYAEAIRRAECNTIHMTYIHSFDGKLDTYFPDPLANGFRLGSSSELYNETDGGISFEYRVYNRNTVGNTAKTNG